MKYKVIAKRPVYRGRKLILESRLEFEEENNLSYNEYSLQLQEELGHWIFNITEIKKAKHG